MFIDSMDWNIDDIAPGQLFVVEHNAVHVHKWDETNQVLCRRTDCLPIGTCIFLSATWLRCSWEIKLAEYHGYGHSYIVGNAASNKKTADFHQFIHEENFVLLDRKDIDALELPQFSKVV